MTRFYFDALTQGTVTLEVHAENLNEAIALVAEGDFEYVPNTEVIKYVDPNLDSGRIPRKEML